MHSAATIPTPKEFIAIACAHIFALICYIELGLLAVDDPTIPRHRHSDCSSRSPVPIARHTSPPWLTFTRGLSTSHLSGLEETGACGSVVLTKPYPVSSPSIPTPHSVLGVLGEVGCPCGAPVLSLSCARTVCLLIAVIDDRTLRHATEFGGPDSGIVNKANVVSWALSLAVGDI
ncbi:hypothetical protein DENSPDRAFT_64602 [Dentipellis sp. KUC8613]|nr:hypothetical protein DENSPDRAFT_64602 [Dentipellis sp. KUC8613]